MEHERGAFKVNREMTVGAVKKGSETRCFPAAPEDAQHRKELVPEI